ncbi:outer membrane protein assembly factor BamB family protein [Streptomyces sp. NPDC002920]
MSQPPVPPPLPGRPAQQPPPPQRAPQPHHPYQAAAPHPQNPYAQPSFAPPPHRRTPLVLGAAAAALAVLVTGTVLLLRGGDGSARSDGRTTGATASASPAPTPTGTDARELLRVDPPEAEGDTDFVQTYGTWLTPRHYASGAKDAVTGYDLTTGRLAWTVRLSGQLCGVSHDATSTGLVAVVFHATKDSRHSHCTRFAVIDVNKGAKVWEKPLTDDSVGLGLGLNVAISDTVAAAGWPGGSAARSTSTGAPVWNAPAAGCTQEEHLGGEQLLTLSFCESSAGPRFRVAQRDPRTGRATWKYEVPKARGAWLVSREPLVLGLLRNEDGLDADQLVTVSDDGRVRSTIDLGDDYVAGCGEVGGCHATVVAGNTAYLGSDAHSFATGNRITAFDLTTGKARRDFPAPDGSTLVPVRADGTALVAVQEAEPTTPARVLRLDPATGSSTTLLETRNDLSLNSTLHSMIRADARDPVLYDNGRLFLHRSSLLAVGNPKPLTLAFTTW